MTALLHFEDKVHRKGLARAEGLPLLMPRLLSQVLEHLRFPEEPRIERRIRCPQVLFHGAILDHADLFSPQEAGSGGGTR